MDARLFRLPTEPNLFSKHRGPKQIQASRATQPTKDARFPGWAAPVADGRLVTDYRYHHEVNIPVEAQESSRVWMQQNADSIRLLSRQRLAETTGAVYGVDMETDAPAALIVDCTTAGCRRLPTGEKNGIGAERASATAPELFMTWRPDSILPPPPSNTKLTQKQEGGRNSRRG